MNYVVNTHVLRSLGVPYRMFISGDDGIIRVPHHVELNTQMWRDLGFNIKLVETDVLTSGFCGFKAVESEGRYHRVGSPAALVNMMWCDKNRNYRGYEELTAAKAYSALCQYDGDVIIGSFAVAYLSVHHGAKTFDDTYWNRELLKWLNVSATEHRGRLFFDDALITEEQVRRNLFGDATATAEAYNITVSECEELRVEMVGLALTRSYRGHILERLFDATITMVDIEQAPISWFRSRVMRPFVPALREFSIVADKLSKLDIRDDIRRAC